MVASLPCGYSGLTSGEYLIEFAAVYTRLRTLDRLPKGDGRKGGRDKGYLGKDLERQAKKKQRIKRREEKKQKEKKK